MQKGELADYFSVLDKSTGNDEKWSGSGYIFKVEPTGFAGRLDVGYERKKEVKNDFEVFSLSSVRI